MVKVLFFGLTRDIAVRSEKHYKADDTDSLMVQLKDDYPALRSCRFRVAVNGVISNGNTCLNENDTVALLPPFAGG